MELREYVITLHTFEDLDLFYEDMEKEGGSLYVPNRAVEVANRRPISRNTHYLLTKEEADQIKNDPRVLDVELTLDEQGLSLRPLWNQTSDYWNKSNTVNNLHLNWGLLRCTEGVQRSNWGQDGSGTTNQSATVTVTSSGKNVDVVIVDGHFNPAHPEFAVNPDGTGGSRVIQYDWFGQHDTVVRGSGLTITEVYRNSNEARITTSAAHGLSVGNTIGVTCTSNNSFDTVASTVTSIISSTKFSYTSAGTNILTTASATGSWIGVYVYTPYVDASYPDNNGDGISDRTDDNDHGTHVAGTACGNKYGWARDSKIYNISPYSTSPSVTSNFLDYVKEWHKSKPINPITGRKNPTVTNHSYGLSYSVDITTITTVRYLGTIYSGSFTENQLRSYGIYNTGGYAIFDLRNTGIEADLLDLIDLGVIVVGAAGNETNKIANYNASTSDYYNNYFEDAVYRYYYGRGSITSAGTTTNRVLCIGSIGTSTNEIKVSSSNAGPRIDVWAPGRHIMSSINSNIGVTVTDTRDSQYYLTKKTGTSMASPQVAGALACLAEQWPTMKQNQAVEYVIANAKTNQITDTGGGLSDNTDLYGAPNRYFYYKKERQDAGQVGPKLNQGVRPAAGMVFPRPKIYRYGR